MSNDYDVAARDIAANAVAAVCLRYALHTGDPGGANSAANEVTGGSPAYARRAVAWAAASGGAAAQVGDVTFDVPPSTITWVSGWNTLGTIRYFKEAVLPEVFAAQGTYTIRGTTSQLNFNL